MLLTERQQHQLKIDATNELINDIGANLSELDKDIIKANIGLLITKIQLKLLSNAN